MPIGNYDAAFGGKQGAAGKALKAMVKEYGQKKGTSVFYASVNKRKKKKHRGGLKDEMRARRHRK